MAVSPEVLASSVVRSGPFARERRSAEVLGLVRVIAVALFAVMALTSPTPPGLRAAALPLVDLAIGAASLATLFAVHRSTSRDALRRIAWASVAVDLAVYLGSSLWLHDIPGASVPIGLILVFDAPVRLGWWGAGAATVGVGSIALALPQQLADGTSQPVAIVVLLVLALPLTAAWASSLLRSHSQRIDDAQALIRVAFDQAANGLALIDADGRITLANRTLRHAIGSSDGLLGRSVEEALASAEWDGGVRADLEAVALGRRAALRVDGRRDGRSLVLSARRVGDADGRRPVLLQIDDVTERAAYEAELAHQATHDPLTGLVNRRLMTTMLSDLLAEGTTPTVVFLDLDRFKDINDEHGHLVGDRVLRIVAERLRNAIRPSDVVGRLAGDEFLVLCGPLLPDDAAALAARIERAVAGPIEVDLATGPLRVEASVGVDLPSPHDHPDDVIARADAAMYRAKRRRRRTKADAVRTSPGGTAEAR